MGLKIPGPKGIKGSIPFYSTNLKYMKKFRAIYLNDSEDNFEVDIDNNLFYNAICVDVTDTYHTFTELYNHRHALFLALTKIYDNYITPLGTRVRCYKSKLHEDGTMFDDMFIVWMEFINFDQTLTIIDYHLPNDWWDKFNLLELPHSPYFDGHTSNDVIERLMKL